MIATTLAALLVATGPAVAPLLRADPATLRLGSGARARLRIEAAEPPRLVASAGRIEGLRETAAGVFEAEYVPPRETYPQVAILAALAAGRAGWVAVPLVGSGEAVVRTSPNARISVTIGDASFGPVRADARGVALVPVLVPPGVGHAVHRGQPIDLHVPPVPHVAVVIDPVRLRADRDEVAVVRAFAVHPDGRARARAPVRLEPSVGTLSDLEEVAPGAFEARWSLPAGPAGAATVTASLADEGERGVRPVARVERGAGPPVRVSVEPDRRALAPADGPLRIRARIEDAAGNPADDPAELAASFGAMAAWARVGPGTWEGLIEVPRARGGRSAIEVRVRSGSAEGAGEAALVAGPPVALALAPEGGALELRRRSTAIEVTAVDVFGNAADLGPPVIEASAGGVSGPERPEGGRYRFTYRSPRVRPAGDEALTARAGGLERVTRYELVPPRHQLEASARAGLGVAQGGVRAAIAGVRLAPLLRLGGGKVGPALDASAISASWSERAAASGRTVSVDGQLRLVALQALLVARRPLGPGTASIAAGGGLARQVAELTVEEQRRSSATASVGVLSVAASYGLRVGPGLALGELRLQHVLDPGRGPVRGSLDLLSLGLGYAFDLL